MHQIGWKGNREEKKKEKKKIKKIDFKKKEKKLSNWEISLQCLKAKKSIRNGEKWCFKIDSYSLILH